MKHKKLAIGGGIAGVIAIIAIAASAAAGGGAPPITAHGTTEDCTATLGDGSQVAVTNSAGTVIATATLSTDNSPAALALIKESDQLSALQSALGGGGTGMMVYDWTVTVPAGQARYGVTVGTAAKGTLWYSEQQMRSGPSTSLGC